MFRPFNNLQKPFRQLRKRQRKSQAVKEKWENYEIYKKRLKLTIYSPKFEGESLPSRWMNIERLKLLAKFYEKRRNQNRLTVEIPREDRMEYVKEKLEFQYHQVS